MKNHQNEINHQAWKEIISLKSEMITMWGIYWKLFNHCMNQFITIAVFFRKSLV